MDNFTKLLYIVYGKDAEKARKEKLPDHVFGDLVNLFNDTYYQLLSAQDSNISNAARLESIAFTMKQNAKEYKPKFELYDGE